MRITPDGVTAVADAFIYFTYFEITGLRDNKLPAVSDRLGVAERDFLRNPADLAVRIRSVMPGQFCLPNDQLKTAIFKTTRIPINEL